VVEQVQLLLRIAFVVFLYLFIWRIVRSSLRDVRVGQESMVLSPRQVAAALGAPVPAPAAAAAGAGERRQGRRGRLASPHLLVVESPTYPPGTKVLLESDVTFGRSPEADAPLVDDQFASSRHARVEVRDGRVHLLDLGSTNGTYVNGGVVHGDRELAPGDLVTIGSTVLRLEGGAG
jgi:FHA domain